MLHDDGLAVIAISYMSEGGSCIEDCEQPDTCPVTGAPIPSPMPDIMEKALIKVVDHPVVLTTSRIVTMSGIQVSDLAKMLSTLASLDEGNTIGIATSSRCHGIINLFQVSEKRAKNVDVKK